MAGISCNISEKMQMKFKSQSGSDLKFLLEGLDRKIRVELKERSMASTGVKDFYRQKKKGGATKTSSSSKKKTHQYTGGASVVVSNTAQTSALISHGSLDLKDDFSEQEEQLRQFDMDMKFGPCIGVNRLQRWERASAMGLQPPPHLRDLLMHTASINNGNNGSPSPECLWEGKV